MKKKVLSAIVTFFSAAVLTTKVAAICPVCVMAVGTGLGISRWLGISDLVSSIWIGGFLASMSLWTINWINRKKMSFKWVNEIIFISFYLMVIAPLWISGAIGNPANKFLGADKILLGMAAGTVIFMAAEISYEIIKKRNNGKTLFPFQKVVMPILALTAASAAIYFTGV